MTSKTLCVLVLVMLAGCSRSPPEPVPTEVITLADGSRCAIYDGRDGIYLECRSRGNEQ